MLNSRQKLLLIRFSSFGDVTQCLSVPTRLKELDVEIHWVTRHDMVPLLENHPAIDRIWSLDRKSGFRGLLDLISALKKEGYSHIYDAHNNLRSQFISLMLRPPFALNRFFDPPLFLRKSQHRWKRFLLFRWRKNFFRQPFSGQRDLLEPLAGWGLSESLPPTPQIFVSEKIRQEIAQRLHQAGVAGYVALAPSAAFELKRWPIEFWARLIELFPRQKFIVLGGTTDQFLNQLSVSFPDRVLNWSGTTSLSQSAAVVALSQALVANDTGILHLGEQLGIPSIALMGPAPFGFPSRPSTRIMQLTLSCRPCSKHGQGPCTNSVYQQCLRGISPESVAAQLREIIPDLRSSPLSSGI